MNIQKLLKNYRKLLNPTPAQEEKVYLKVFGEYPKKNNYLNIFNMKQFKFKQVLLAAFLVFTFIAAPMLYVAYKGPSGAIQQTSLGSAEDPYDNAPIDKGALLDEVQERINSQKDKSDNGLVTTPKPSKYTDYEANINTVQNPPSKAEDTSTPEYLRSKNINALLNLRNENVQKLFNDTQSIITNLGGYISSSQFRGTSTSGTQIIAKVPADKFDEFMQRIHEMNVSIVQEEINITDRQTELTELMKTKQLLEDEIKKTEEQISKETDQNKKAGLSLQLSYLKSTQSTNTDKISKLQAQTLFATIQVNFTKPVFQLFSTNFDEFLINIRTVASFWFQVAIYLAVPVGLYVAYKYWKKRKNK